MANPIQVTNINPRQFVGSSSRYAASKVLYYGTNNLLTFGLYQRPTQNLSPNDKYAVISKATEYRPDLASYKYYGAPDFWWRIMEANGMIDILEFKAGTNIRLPDVLLNQGS
jgi:hypothetical protein